MKVVISGGTGFVGSHIVRSLTVNGHYPTLIVRHGRNSKIDSFSNTDKIAADPRESLEHIHIEADLLINCVGIIREFPRRGILFEKIHVDIVRNLIEFAKTNNIPKIIQISALGTGPEGDTAYFRTKYQAEEMIKQSGLSWTVLRPSMIMGRGNQVTPMLGRMIRFLPAVPVFGDGQYQLQPVLIDDLANTLARSIDKIEIKNRIFEIGGPEIITYNAFLDRIGKGLGRKRVRKIHIPVTLARYPARILGRFSWFPFTDEQITMLLSGSSTKDNSFFELGQISPRPFDSNPDDIL